MTSPTSIDGASLYVL